MRLRQHPSHPNYSQLGFRVHPPNPPQGGLSCSAAFRSDQMSQQQSTTGMGRVVGPRGLCRNQQTRQKRAENRGQGRAGQGRAGQTNGRGFGVLLVTD